MTEFEQLRKLLFNLAYRMLGSVADAEDTVQEACLRWEKLAKGDIQSPRAYLSTIVTRLSIDLLRKRRANAIGYAGPWLPEPIVTEEYPGPEEHLEIAKDLSFAMLFLLERLNPRERAVFVLKEALDFDHGEIAEILNVRADTSRQLLSRARKKLKQEVPKTKIDIKEQKRVITRLMSALMKEDIEEVKSLLTSDAVAYTDGGGIVSAAIIPLVGVDRITQVFSHLFKKYSALSSRHEWSYVNGDLGVSVYLDERLSSIISIEFRDDRIDKIFVQRNPTKFSGVVQPANLS